MCLYIKKYMIDNYFQINYMYAVEVFKNRYEAYQATHNVIDEIIHDESLSDDTRNKFRDLKIQEEKNRQEYVSLYKKVTSGEITNDNDLLNRDLG